MEKIRRNQLIDNILAAQQTIRSNVAKFNTILEPLGLFFKVTDFGEMFISDGKQYFCSLNNGDFFGGDDRLKVLSDHVENLEFPVLESEVLPICKLLGMNEEVTKKVLSKCESIEAREAFNEYERRHGSW